ncbi:MAG TPA: aminotransferase class III-fold pyridoxal phosphate-dependent enzyme, partial [Thermoanaerobaculia bacterium]|nr:aminotransferase class III-fold pyridoxal phosphate-dependent enzyme [Thermoanaerobaculia bacterium]
MSSQPPPSARQARIAATVQGIVGRVLRIPPRDLDIEAPFLELGADSLALVEALRGLQESFGVKLTIRQLFEQLPSIAVLAAFLDQTLPPEAAPAAAPAAAVPAPAAIAETGASCPLPAPAPVPVQVQVPIQIPAAAPPLPAIPLPAAPAVGASALERVFGLQIQAFNQLVAQQLQTLGARPAGGTVPAPAPRPAAAAPSPAPSPVPPAPPAPPGPAEPQAAAAPAAARPVLPTFLGKAGGRPGAVLSERQRRHLDELTSRYCAKTAKSKELTERFRPWLADSRATVGFRATSKEMLYPLARARARGSRVWDVDGNEYVDVTMGMGVHLFGHHPEWLQESIERQVREGFELGPRSAHSGEAAALFCELTGLERATFTNSGTEACMTAIRLARARTGRTRIAMFAGSYHGHSDGTLAQTQEVDGELRSFPVAPG